MKVPRKNVSDEIETCSFHTYVWEKSKKFTHLEGFGVKGMRLIFKTKMLICQSKANLDVKILEKCIKGHFLE